jgi:hypothetical protein
MFGTPPNEGPQFKGIDWTKDQSGVQSQIDNTLRKLEIKAIEARTAPEGERNEKIAKMAADIDRMQADFAAHSAQVDVARGTARAMAGDCAQLKQFAVEYSPNGSKPLPVALFRSTVPGPLGRPVEVAGLLDSEDTHGEWHHELKNAVIAGKIAASIKGGRSVNPTRINFGDINRHAPKSADKIALLMARAPSEVRALAAHDVIQRVFSATSDAAGGYAIPDEMLSPVIAMDAKYDPSMPLSMDSIGTEVMTGARFDQVFMSGNTRPYIYGTAGSDAPSKFTASSATWAKNSTQPINLAIRYVADINAVEDSILPSFAALQATIARDLALAREDAFHNSDTASTHQDTGLATFNPNSMWGTTSGAGSSLDHRRSIRGLRARALDASATSDAAGAITRAMLTGTLPSVLDAAHQTSPDLCLYMANQTYLKQISKLSEVSTVEKFGAQATIKGFRLAAIDGIMVETSPFIDEQFNASGIFDDTTKTKTVIEIANRGRFRWALRRGVSISMVVDQETGTIALVATVRFNLRDVDNGETGTGIKNTALLYNITK